MGRWSTLGGAVGGIILLVVSAAPGCGGKTGSQFNAGSNSSTSGMFGDYGDGSVGQLGGGGTAGGGGPYGMTTGAMCPTGAMCDVSCAAGTTTTISGVVHDPAGKNPLYGISVYVPGGPLQPLPKGVPTGADACSCAALYKSGAIVSTTTDVNGKFTLQNAPVGKIQLVVQVGKWRHVVDVTTTACQDTTAVSTDLNATVAAGSLDNMPDIAVSTGNADTLECLMKRIGLPDTEYVAGTSTAGHVHVYSGGAPGGNAGNNVGNAEANPMPNAPESDTNLWDTSAHLMPYDILLLSCEGGETYKASPGNLETYLNAGGRAFASHFHYAWFSDKLESNQNYATPVPAVWGANLATWTTGGGENTGPDDGVIVQTLNVGGGPFVKGQMLDQWLGIVGALGQNGVPAADLGIYAPRFNAQVAAADKPSQPWITDEMTTTGGGGGTCFGRRCDAGGGGGTTSDWTMYFSFDTPVTATAPADGGEPNYCGRAVFSDLHVSGCSNTGACNVPYPSAMDSPNSMNGQPPPGGCTAGDLSPQEKALEFMLFDLSSCVISDSVAPPTMVPVVVN
jgi:hypothetical protein